MLDTLHKELVGYSFVGRLTCGVIVHSLVKYGGSQ